MESLDDRLRRDFEFFLKILIEATARIEPHYFQLPVAGREESIYRERVYCYELYHRIRECMPGGYQYVLNGEVDKSGHPFLRDEIGPKKPDFIVHVPGEMDRNLAVIEVKPINAAVSEAREDLRTLRAFLERARYHRAIQLVYGNGSQERYEMLAGSARKGTDIPHGRVLFVWHRQPLEPAVIAGGGV